MGSDSAEGNVPRYGPNGSPKRTPDERSQTLAVWSSEEMAMVRPSGESETWVICPVGRGVESRRRPGAVR